MSNEISEKKIKLSNMILKICKSYLKENNINYFFNDMDCIKPERGQYLNSHQVRKITFDDISFINGDDKKYIFASPVKVSSAMNAVMPLFVHIKNNLSDDEWFKFVIRQKSIFTFDSHYLSKYKFSYEVLLCLSEISVSQLSQHLDKINWEELSEFKKDVLSKKFHKIYNFKNIHVKNILSEFLIKNNIDDDRVNELKFLKSSVFVGKSVLIPVDMLSLECSDILNVVSWRIPSNTKKTDFLDSIYECFTKAFQKLGIKVARIKMKSNQYSLDTLTMSFSKVTKESEKVLTNDIKEMIDNILKVTESIADLKSNKVDIVVNHYILNQQVAYNAIKPFKGVKF